MALTHANAELFKTDIPVGTRVLEAAKETVARCEEKNKVCAKKLSIK